MWSPRRRRRDAAPPRRRRRGRMRVYVSREEPRPCRDGVVPAQVCSSIRKSSSARPLPSKRYHPRGQGSTCLLLRSVGESYERATPRRIGSCSSSGLDYRTSRACGSRSTAWTTARRPDCLSTMMTTYLGATMCQSTTTSSPARPARIARKGEIRISHYVLRGPSSRGKPKEVVWTARLGRDVPTTACGGSRGVRPASRVCLGARRRPPHYVRPVITVAKVFLR